MFCSYAVVQLSLDFARDNHWLIPITGYNLPIPEQKSPES
jgi:hypothetical protein